MKCDKCQQKFGGSVALKQHLDEAGNCIPASELDKHGLKLNYQSWYITGMPRRTRAVDPRQIITR